jgi:hypothetical protein
MKSSVGRTPRVASAHSKIADSCTNGSPETENILSRRPIEGQRVRIFFIFSNYLIFGAHGKFANSRANRSLETESVLSKRPIGGQPVRI